MDPNTVAIIVAGKLANPINNGKRASELVTHSIAIAKEIERQIDIDSNTHVKLKCAFEDLETAVK